MFGLGPGFGFSGAFPASGGGGSAPALVSLESNFDGDRITITADATLLATDANWEQAASFTLAGTSAVVYAAGKPTGATCVLRLLGHIKPGETPTLSYTPGATPLASSGGALASFATQAVDLTALDTTTVLDLSPALVLDADYVTVDGSGFVTAVADQSGNSRNGSVDTPGAGLTVATIEGRDWLVFNQTQFIKFVDAGLVGLVDGANGPVTVLASIQNMNTAQQYVCCWGANTSNQNALRFEFDSSRNLSIKKRITSTTNALGTDNDLNFDAQIAVWRAGSTGLVRQQGSDDGAGAIALPSGSFTATYFSVGALVTNTGPTTTANARFRLRKLIVIPGVKTNGEIAALERMLARDAGIQHAGLGLTAHPSLVVHGVGQSNAEGRSTTDYTRTQSAILRYAHSGHYNVAAEPFSDPTNAAYTPSFGAHVADGGWKVRYGDLVQAALRTAGKDYDVILLEDAVGGSSMSGSGDANSWATNLTTLPRPVSNLSAIAQLRLGHVLARGNCQILNTLNWQIEANAQDGTEAAAINTGWQTWYDNYDTNFSGYYVEPTFAHVACKGQPAAPDGGTGYGSWATARAAWDTLAAAYSELQLVAALDAGPFTDGTNLHYELGADGTEGLRYVAAQAAALVIAGILPSVT